MRRKPLPDRRALFTTKAIIEGTSFYLGFGEYPDGTLGEVWLDAHKTGTFARGILNALCRVISVALQYGVPIEAIVDILEDMNFPPNGLAEGERIKPVKSIVDWVASEIKFNYLPKETDNVGTAPGP